MVEMTTNKLLRQIFESELSTNGVKITNNKKVIITPKSSLRVHIYCYIYNSLVLMDIYLWCTLGYSGHALIVTLVWQLPLYR